LFVVAAEGKGQPTSGGGFFVPGADVAPLKEALTPATEVLKVARAYGACVVHTSASKDTGTGLNLAGGVIPLAGELVVHHSPNAKGAFWNTNLEKELRGRGVTSLVVTGVTTDGCVQITMREANDRGFKCVVVEEATATYIPQYKELALDMISSPGGIGGRRCKLAEALHAFDPTSSLRLGTA
jgi:nicotinamidase-related amidase